MKSWSLRIAFAVVVLVVVGTLALVLRPAPSTSLLPSPNGYDDFVAAAAALLKDKDFSDYSRWTPNELAERVAANSNVFALVRAGLQKESRAPAWRAEDDLSRLPRLASFKSLAYALVACGHLARLEGRTNEVAEISLDGVQMAHGIARGGVLIEALVGMADEAIALRPLAVAMDGLDAPTARAAARRLTDLDRQAPTVAETMASEYAFSRSHGLYGTFMATLNRFGFGPLVAGRKRFEAKWTIQAVRRRELILQLARRAFELERGSPPAKDTELVPDYLPSLPVVPTPITNSVRQ